jgi:hypothetical protein
LLGMIMILPVTLYGCETLSLTCRKEHKLCLRLDAEKNIWTQEE